MTIFLDAFLPNLAATIIGVILGLPIALYVNRRLTEHQHALEHIEQTRRRDDSVKVLVTSCEYNMKVFERMRELALTGKVMRNPDLRSTTWDAVNNLFSALCPDPVLLQKLSHHWLRLQRLERLNREVFDREVGTLPPIPDQQITLGMWGELHDQAMSLHKHAAELIEDLNKLTRTALGSSTNLDA